MFPCLLMIRDCCSIVVNKVTDSPPWLLAVWPAPWCSGSCTSSRWRRRPVPPRQCRPCCRSSWAASVGPLSTECQWDSGNQHRDHRSRCRLRWGYSQQYNSPFLWQKFNLQLSCGWQWFISQSQQIMLKLHSKLGKMKTQMNLLHRLN